MKFTAAFFALFLAGSCLAQDPVVQGKSAIIIDAATGKVLWAKDAEAPRYPASTTKIMTALLTLESKDLFDLLKAPAGVTSVEGSSLHLKPGEEISVEDAVYAMILRSANDVCYMAAVRLAGSVSAFAARMNERANEIGCTGTHFDNPHGLPDKAHVTTAHDLARIARVAMKNPVFREVAKTRQRVIQRSINQEDTFLETRNKWLLKDPTADGIKTGFTNDAGHCYVGSAVRNGFRVITVIMNSPDTQVDQDAMLKWSFSNYEVGLSARPGELLFEAPIAGGKVPTFKLSPMVDTQLLSRIGTKANFNFRLENAATAPIKAGQKLGYAVANDGAGFQVRVPVVALENVDVKPQMFNLEGRIPAFAWYALGAAVAGGALLYKKRTRIY